MIQIQQLHKSFGRLEVLKKLDLEFNQPGISAILGPNGSGKTTLIKCLLGMVLPDQGQILFEGQNVAGKWQYRDQISYLPQIARFPENLKVGELFKMLGEMRPRESQESSLISYFGLEAFLDKKLGNLSGGTRQKVNLVSAFMYDNPLLILDEPTAGLDPVSVLKLKDWLFAEKARGKTILITTHIMSFVEEMADEIVFLMDGNIHFRGSTDHLKEQYDVTSLERGIAAMLSRLPIASAQEEITISSTK